MTENKEQYELEQKQRYNERMIREWKRREQIMKAAGLDSTYEGSKVKEWQNKNKALIDAHSDILKRDYGREKAYLAKSKSKNQMHYKLNNQLFGRNPKDYDSIKLGTREYARVVSQLNTNLTREELKTGIKTKAIGDYFYTFEVIDFDEYRFISKTRIKKLFMISKMESDRMSELTELEKKLVEKARTVSQDKDFFLAVLNYADTEEDQQAIIDYIDKGQDVNEQNVTLLSVFLYNKRYHPERNLAGNGEF